MRLRRVDLVESSGSVEGPRSTLGLLTARDGLLLRVEDLDGYVGYGEASPLPGYSPDTLTEAREVLEMLDWEKVPEAEEGESAADWLSRLASVPLALHPGLPPLAPAGSPSRPPAPPSSRSMTPPPSTRRPKTFPAARFAVETALLDLLGQRRKLPIHRLFSEQTEPVPLCFMVGGAEDGAVVNAARRAAAAGAHTIKVKFSGPFLDAQLPILEQVREAIGNTTLRLDANQSIPGEVLARELARLAPLSPEFVEEPSVPAAVLGLREPAVPVALDESLQNESLWAGLAPAVPRIRCVAAVLKPMTLGGFGACLTWASRVRALGLDVTVSHAFDGPFALAAAAHIALIIGSRTRGSGLARHGGLGAWPAVDIPLISGTQVVPPSATGLGVAPAIEDD